MGGRTQFVITRIALVLLGQEIHGKMDTSQLTAFDFKVPGVFRPAGHDQDVVIVQQALNRNGNANFEIGAEDHAFGFQLGHPTINQVLLHLEVWDAIAKQAANPVVLFEDRGRMPRPRQLLRAGQTSRA